MGPDCLRCMQCGGDQLEVGEISGCAHCGEEFCESCGYRVDFCTERCEEAEKGCEEEDYWDER